MNKIELESVNEESITISFEENDERKTCEITGLRAIEVIMVFGKALRKKSFLSIK